MGLSEAAGKDFRRKAHEEALVATHDLENGQEGKPATEPMLVRERRLCTLCFKMFLVLSEARC